MTHDATKGHGPARRVTARELWLVATLALLVLIAVASTTATAISQPAIEQAFSASAADVGAVVVAYVAAFAIATSVYGKLGQRFGTARVLAIGTTILVLGALAAATAQSLAWLVVARVVQGLGAGAAPTLAVAIISDRHQHQGQRGRMLGLLIVGVGAGHALGPLLGGILVDAVSWRAAVSLGLLALPAVIVVPRLHRPPPDPRVRLDPVGALLVALVVGAGVWAVSQGLRSLPGPAFPIALLAAAMGIVGVRLRAARVPDAFVPGAVLANTSFWRCCLLGAVGMSLFLGVVTGLPLVLGAGAAVSGVALGLTLLPMATMVALVSPHHGRVVAAIGRERTTVVALGGIIAGAGLVVLASRGSSDLAVAASLVPAGAGFGLLNAPLLGQVGAEFDEPHRSMALGLFNVAYFAGGALGSATTAVMLDAFGETRWTGFMAGLALLSVLAGVTAVGASRRGSGESARVGPERSS